MMDNSGNSWTEWSRFVLEELKRLNKKLDSIETEVHSVKVEQKNIEMVNKELLELRKEQSSLKLKVNTMEVRAAVYGSIAGVAITLLGLLMGYLKQG